MLPIFTKHLCISFYRTPLLNQHHQHRRTGVASSRASNMAVERVIDHRVLDGEDPEFLVKWKGHPYTACLWLGQSKAPLTPGMEEGLQEYRNFLARCRSSFERVEGQVEEEKKDDQQYPSLQQKVTKIYNQAGKILTSKEVKSLSWAVDVFDKGGKGVVFNDESERYPQEEALVYSACALLRCLEAKVSLRDRPFLVLTKANKGHQWLKLLRAFAPHLRVVDYTGDAGSRMVARHHDMSLRKRAEEVDGGGGMARENVLDENDRLSHNKDKWYVTQSIPSKIEYCTYI